MRRMLSAEDGEGRVTCHRISGSDRDKVIIETATSRSIEKTSVRDLSPLLIETA
jgi:hypothetical protein